MKQICEYEAFDGTRFESPYECRKYENYINYSGKIGKVIKEHLFGTDAEYLYNNSKSDSIKQFIFSHKPTQEQLINFVGTFHTNSIIGIEFKVLFMNNDYAFIEITKGASSGFYFIFKIEKLPEITNENT